MSKAPPTALKPSRWPFWKRVQSFGKATETEETFYRAGQWQLVWWKFRRHKLAQIAMVVLGIFYLIVIFAEFISPYDPQKRFKDFSGMAPAKVHLIDAQGRLSLPFVYALKRARDPVTLWPIYEEDKSAAHYPVALFVSGDEYKLWGLFSGNIHLFGVKTEPGTFTPLFLLGSDALGHDLLSRIFFG